MPSPFANLRPRVSYVIVDRRGQTFVGHFVRIVNANGLPAAEFEHVYQGNNKPRIPLLRFLESQVRQISSNPANDM